LALGAVAAARAAIDRAVALGARGQARYLQTQLRSPMLWPLRSPAANSGSNAGNDRERVAPSGVERGDAA